MKITAKKLVSFVIAMAMVLTCIIPAMSGTGSATVSAADDKPLVTIACMSDLHNQTKAFSSNPKTIRQPITTTVDLMKAQEEKIDAIFIGGDVSSDSNPTEANLYGIIDLVEAKMCELTKNTMWIIGNHDFNAGSNNYNSGDYYNREMKPNMGAVASDDDIHTDNYKGIDYVTGYHYVINGFDFIGLSASYDILEGTNQKTNYKFSDATLEWLNNTLERIGKNKTVFIAGHFPFRDSNSISAESKGFLEDCNAKLKKTFLEYPNVVYFYGHDHGGDLAYSRTDSQQRITVYDTEGKVLNPLNTSTYKNQAIDASKKTSFVTSFMGSLGYYKNVIDGTQYEKDPTIIQALLVYVYADRIEFVIKNYGTKNGENKVIDPSSGNNALPSFTIKRNVLDNPPAVDVKPTEAPDNPTATNEPGGTDNPTATNEPGGTDNPTATNEPGGSDNPTATVAPTTNAPSTAPTVTTPSTGQNGSGTAVTPAAATVKAPTGLKVKRSGKKVTITFKKVAGADGYEIVCSKKKASGYKKLLATKKVKATSKKAKKGNFIKVKAYKTVDGKKVYSAFTKPVKVK